MSSGEGMEGVSGRAFPVDHRPSPHDEGVARLPDLLARSASGDEAAFADLYTIVSPRLFGMALGVLGHRSQAEQVTQEALVTIWTTCARFDARRGSALGWMLAIAHRRAVDRVRQSEASSRRDEVWARDLDRTVDDGHAEAVDASANAAEVKTALRNLSPTQKAAVSLAYFRGLTHSEVASSLGIPADTAKSRIRDGLLALGVALGPSAGMTGRSAASQGMTAPCPVIRHRAGW